MKRTFKEEVVHKTAVASKKHKLFSPVFILLAAVILAFYSLGNYFYSNGKRYISLGVVLVFFFMSSSFKFSTDDLDSAIYLSATSANQEMETPLAEKVNEEQENLSLVEWIEDTELSVSSDFESQLAKTDSIDTFTLDDFLNSENVESSSEKASFDKSSWNLILVNKTHPIPDDYEIPLTTISGSMKCDERVLEPLTNMLKAASNDGVNLIVCSPYRDYTLQETLFNRKINLYMSLGMSYMEAYKTSSQKVTVPGASEHQIGLAFDIVTSSHSTLDYEFGDTAAGKWLKEHSCEYGFILRYPRGKEYITSIEYEPWHFRYVGIEAAKYITENDLTLEEFYESE